MLARSTVDCLETLILLNGEKFTDEMWDSTLDLLWRLFEVTQPKLYGLFRMAKLKRPNATQANGVPSSNHQPQNNT